MRARVARWSLPAALIVALGVPSAYATPAGAESTTCALGGVFKLQPLLTETPREVTVKVHGLLNCNDPYKRVLYRALLRSAPLTCSSLQEGRRTTTAAAGTIRIDWWRGGKGHPHAFSLGKFSMPLEPQGGETPLSGMIETGRFAGMSIAGEVAETWLECGEQEGRRYEGGFFGTAPGETSRLSIG